MLKFLVCVDLLQGHLTDNTKDEFWIEELGLYVSDKKCLESAGSWITDNIINAGQKLLKDKFPELQSLQSVVLAETMSFQICRKEFIQILNVRGNHWITVSSKSKLNFKLYDGVQLNLSFLRLLETRKCYGL